MLKAQEHRIQDKLDRIDKNNELRVKAQSEHFNRALRALKDVAKERHVLYIQDVKTICENVNLKLQELRDDMAKEIKILTRNYSTLHTKVDTIDDAVTEAMEQYTSLVPKFKKKFDVNAINFGNIAKLLGELKDLMSKSGSSSSSLFTPECLTQKFSFLELTIHNELAPLVKLLPLMPTGAPPVVTRVKGGEERNVSIGKSEGGSGKQVKMRR